MKKWNYSKGKESEEKASDLLKSVGYRLIAMNYRCKLGEIDLIMSDRDWLVFVEVKYKTDDKMGSPEEMIDKRKLAQVKRVAEWYLTENQEMKKVFQKYRIDAVCILGDRIKHYENVG